MPGFRIGNKNLAKVENLVKQIRDAAGIPGVAVGIVCWNSVQEIYQGVRDVEAALPVHCDTLFSVASLTNAMIATAIGVLVDQGRPEWTTPVHDILPEMSRDTEVCRSKLTVLDIMSHRTGKVSSNALYLQSSNQVLLPKRGMHPNLRLHTPGGASRKQVHVQQSRLQHRRTCHREALWGQVGRVHGEGAVQATRHGSCRYPPA
jgi:CubicO group peptidase (beta-lactamase class C family)